ncbi:hypothetical protein, partial [Klebsiella pneumoniae]|uniref:hypothetical protein n=2 Tax=Klebsiella pneumoniae TaxID=573 RepID=UPI001C69D4AB
RLNASQLALEDVPAVTYCPEKTTPRYRLHLGGAAKNGGRDESQEKSITWIMPNNPTPPISAVVLEKVRTA